MSGGTVSAAGIAAAAGGAGTFGTATAAIGANLGAISAITAIGAAGVGAAGSIEQGNATSAAAKYNSQVAANNQTIANNNATLAIQSGEAQVGQEQQKTRAVVGGIKAAQAANGVDVNSGSADAVQRSAAELGEQSSINIRANAARQAYGYQTDSMNYGAQAALDQSQVSQDLLAGDIGGTTTLLNGGAKAAVTGFELSGGN